MANGDTSQPQVAIHSYPDATSDHAPISTRLADISISWRPDPDGQLYRGVTTGHFALGPEDITHLVVAGYRAVSYAHWTDAPSNGGLYEQHVYLWAPPYQEDLDIALMAANPPGRDVARERAVFAQVLRSFVIGPPPSTSTASPEP